MHLLTAVCCAAEDVFDLLTDEVQMKLMHIQAQATPSLPAAPAQVAVLEMFFNLMWRIADMEQHPNPEPLIRNQMAQLMPYVQMPQSA